VGDVGDFWNDVRAARAEKRAKNREQSTRLLGERKIVFQSFNGGAHLIIEHRDLTVDYWPGTGRWHVRGGTKGFGVKKLLKRLNEEDQGERKT